MDLFIIFIIFVGLLKLSLGIVPIWNIANSAINLLPSGTNEYNYFVVDRELYALHCRLKKYIKRTETGITHENKLFIKDESEFNVDFENIESFYEINNIYIICPKDKYRLYDAKNKNNIDLSSIGFNDDSNWDLKGYSHNTKYFLSFYLNDEKNQFFFQKVMLTILIGNLKK